MTMLSRILFTCLFLCLSISAQTATTRILPDCVWSFTSASAGPTGSFDNRTTQCNNWVLTWEVFGSSPAVSGTFQQAPSNAAGTTPGTFVTWASAPLSGNNPSTAVANLASFSGFMPWTRVNFTSLTGSVRGTLLGWRIPSATSSGGGGGPSTNVNVLNFPNPQNVLTQPVCTQQANIGLSSSGSTQIIAASAGQAIKICHISLSLSSAVDIELRAGTGTNCATSPSPLTGIYASAVGIALDLALNPITTAASQAFCINLSAAATGGGLLVYTQN